MVKKKNYIKIKKPILDCDGVKVIMDMNFFENTDNHFKSIHKEFPIKKIHDKDFYLLVEFIDPKHTIMYNLKYGNQK